MGNMLVDAYIVLGSAIGGAIVIFLMALGYYAYKKEAIDKWPLFTKCMIVAATYAIYNTLQKYNHLSSRSIGYLVGAAIKEALPYSIGLFAASWIFMKVINKPFKIITMFFACLISSVVFWFVLVANYYGNIVR